MHGKTNSPHQALNSSRPIHTLCGGRFYSILEQRQISSWTDAHGAGGSVCRFGGHTGSEVGTAEPAAVARVASVGLRRLLLELEDARVHGVGHLGEKQEVVPAEALGALSIVAVLVEALECDVLPRAACAFVPPNCRLDAADSEFRNWYLVCHD